MNELIVKGTQKFMGQEIPVVEGGFGENKKVVLARDVALIHEIEVKDVNKLITNNLDEFEDNIDILDLCDENFKVIANHLGFITSNGQKHCYLLSEQGYLTLAMLMRTPKSKEIRKQFVREYFTMRETIKELTRRQELVLTLYDGGTGALEAHKELLAIETEELNENHANEMKLKQLELEQQKDGNNKILSGINEVVAMLDINGLTSSVFTKWMVDKGLGTMKRYNSDRNRTFTPTETFVEWVAKAGFSMTGTYSTGKPRVIYTTAFVDRILDYHIRDIIEYAKMFKVEI